MNDALAPSPSCEPQSEPVLRTVLGDVPAVRSLGACDAHEHVVLGGAWIASRYPEFVHTDLDRVLVDLQAFRAAGGGWIVDSMPTGSGRDAALLADAARRSGLPIVCPTGVHQSQYYPPDHPLPTLACEPLADLFEREIVEALDDGAGPLPLRAGVIKVASDGDVLADHDRERFLAAAAAHQRTGCPILTHTNGVRDALGQVELLLAGGAAPESVVLSHCDRNDDLAFHRELLQTGVCLEYDQHFRHLRQGRADVTRDLIVALAEEFPDQLLLGMDLARSGYWAGYGGAPGLAWLLVDLRPRLLAAGLAPALVDRLFIDNPLAAFALRPPHMSPAAGT
jgi:phosphotriesterase-related protein